MSHLPELAELHPDLHTRGFWERCACRQLAFQRCTACGRFRHPPRPGCPHCAAPALAWEQVRGDGRIHSFTVAHHAAFAALRAHVPYTIVTVEFDDAPGVRLISNLLYAAPDDLHIGRALALVWDEPRPGVVLPRFRPA